MADETPIRSLSNPLIKRVRAAARGVERSLIVLEGTRLVADALAHGLRPEVLLVPEGETDRVSRLAAEMTAAGVEVRTVTDSILQSLSGLKTAPGILALLPVPATRALTELPTRTDALVVVAAGVADPGNLGALARTAEAAAASALIIFAGGCRPWNPRALRGSMGSLLRLPIFEVEEAALAWDALEGAGYRQVLAATRGGSAPMDTDWSGRLALWLSSETGAWSEDLAARVDAGLAAGTTTQVTIPLAAGVESLNVTSAASVLLFSAGRSVNAGAADSAGCGS